MLKHNETSSSSQHNCIATWPALSHMKNGLGFWMKKEKSCLSKLSWSHHVNFQDLNGASKALAAAAAAVDAKTFGFVRVSLETIAYTNTFCPLHGRRMKVNANVNAIASVTVTVYLARKLNGIGWELARNVP